MEPKQNLPTVLAYTQHENTVRVLEKICGIKVVLLNQDRNKDPIEDIMHQLHTLENIKLLVVLPVDKLIELRQRLPPSSRIILMQLDGSIIERETKQPYNPKTEYPENIILKALKLYEIRSGVIKSISGLEELRKLLNGKKVGVFNDVIRSTLQQLIPEANFVKTCEGGCDVEINPLAHKAGIRISFPSMAGRLTAEQMIELFRSGQVRIYYAELDAVEVQPCQ